MALLLTPTILDSFEWMMTAPPGKWKTKATNDFYNKVHRKPGDAIEDWVTRGQELEKQVEQTCTVINMARNNGLDPEIPGSAQFKRIVTHCMDGEFQVVLKEKMFVDGVEWLIYGKLDVKFPDKTLDMKATMEYKGAEKYITKWQGPIYSILTDNPEFEWLVVEWVSKNSNDILDVHYIKHTYNIQKEYQRLEEKLRLFHLYLRSSGLFSAYNEIFSRNKAN